ncbi:MAG: DUF4238 domain-containing protein [Candidatus Methylomirabilales bacterium]
MVVVDHHFIPQFYLRGFRDPTTPEGQEPWLWVADLREQTIERRAPKNVGKQANYYAFPADGGTQIQAVEEMFQKIESSTAPVIAKLLCGDFRLSDEDRTSLSIFMAFFITRVPWFRSLVEKSVGDIGRLMLRMTANRPEYFERKLRDVHEGKQQFTPEEVEELRQWTLDETNYTLQGSPDLSLAMGIRVAPALVPILHDMKWAFLVPPEGVHFVTCDNPVSWVDPTPRPPFYRGSGLLMRKVELSFPVGPCLCLFAAWEGPSGAGEIPVRFVNELNRRRALWADRFVFADHGDGARDALEIRRTLEASRREEIYPGSGRGRPGSS